MLAGHEAALVMRGYSCSFGHAKWMGGEEEEMQI